MVVLAAVCLGHDIAVGIQTVFSARQRNCGWCLDRAVQGEELEVRGEVMMARDKLRARLRTLCAGVNSRL